MHRRGLDPRLNHQNKTRPRETADGTSKITYLNRIMRQTNWIYNGYEVCFSLLSKTFYADPLTAMTSEHRIRGNSKEEIVAKINQVVGKQSYQPA